MAVFKSFDFDSSISDQEYLISCARNSKSNIAISKAWLLTAKTIFPHEMGIQFEDYNLEKSLKNTKDASKCFSDMFHSFPDEPSIWDEVTNITVSLQADQPTPEQSFLKEMFSHLSPDIQQQLLLVTANRTSNTVEHCHLMLLLLRSFPLTTIQYGNGLLDTLMRAQQLNYGNNPVNQFRKILVTDLIPLLIPVELPLQVIYRLLLTTVEFYINYIFKGVTEIEGLPESECIIENPWKSLMETFEGIVKKLGWELSSIFSNPLNKDAACQRITQFVHVHAIRLIEDDQLVMQIFYCTFLLFLNALYEYNTLLNEGDMVMIELPVDFSNNASINEPVPKKRSRTKIAAEEDIALTASHKVTIVRTFTVAFRCFEMFQNSEVLKKEFYQLIQTLKLENWVQRISQDFYLYKGLYHECIEKLMIPDSELKHDLKSICVYFYKQDFGAMLESIVSVVERLSSHSKYNALHSQPKDSQVSPLHKPPPNAKRHLHFLHMKKRPILQYMAKLLIVSLRKVRPRLQSIDLDLAQGHILVLLQLDWPQDELLFNEIVDVIKMNRRFSYNLFIKYIICTTFLEEFMYLSTERGGSVALDILIPTSNQLLNQRRMSTRGVDKGAKEDFKMAMRRQTARINENIETLLIQFIVNEKDAIRHCLNSQRTDL
ncbi:integrator complex subunit 10 [Nilaparvata lugens]|uniref:integrator complex subunit 10 n=1 Tax=Nilaparvata lugens TaxID=108931 RepID=UPI00193D03C2|nr:integrator complex subunit 10 [Nilaparvata lugens]